MLRGPYDLVGHTFFICRLFFQISSNSLYAHKGATDILRTFPGLTHAVMDTYGLWVACYWLFSIVCVFFFKAFKDSKWEAGWSASWIHTRKEKVKNEIFLHIISDQEIQQLILCFPNQFYTHPVVVQVLYDAQLWPSSSQPPIQTMVITGVELWSKQEILNPVQ